MHRLVKDAARFGTRCDDVRLDWPTVVRRQHDIVRELQPSAAAFEATGVPQAVFTTPEVARVGLTHAQARPAASAATR